MAKRAFDVLVTLLSAPLWLPITAAYALLLAVELRGNPLFRQERVGLHGRTFTMVKLRTMRHAAPGEVAPRVVGDPATYVFDPPGQRDPRMTRLGAFARKTSIDELPNLLNVLRGDMSLVGPRPELPEIVAQYPPAYHQRHGVRPGLTGLAQATGRSDLTLAESVTYDLKYARDHALPTDIALIWRTIAIVLAGRGAR